jgi:hypothetical protein
MPDRNADPSFTADDGPAIKMDPKDHAATSSNGNNGRAGVTYRAQTADMIKKVYIARQWHGTSVMSGEQQQNGEGIVQSPMRQPKKCLIMQGPVVNFP